METVSFKFSQNGSLAMFQPNDTEGDVLAEGSSQSILKALRSGIQSGMLHQLADADRELLAIGCSRSSSRGCRRSGRSSCRRCRRTAAGSQGSSCAAGSGSSQKRTTSDFTHNVYLLYLFACAAYRYSTGKLCFVCKARTVSLYTREVYHTFHGKTTHFCPKTAFIIDCIKYIDRLF